MSEFDLSPLEEIIQPYIPLGRSGRLIHRPGAEAQVVE